MKDSLTSYLREPEQDFLDLASTSAGDFKEALERCRQLRITEEESDQADELETLFDESIDEINVAVDLDKSILENEQEFSGLQADLEGVLDEEAQVRRNLHAAEARETTSQVLGEAQTRILQALAAILIALAAILFVASGAAARIGRGIGRFVGRLTRGPRVAAGRLRRGEVGVERRLLLVGIVLAALLWVTQSVLEAYVFEESDFLGALFPSRAEDLLGRGLLAAALIAFLAYLQFVLNRRKQESQRDREDPRKQDNEARFQLAAVVESSDDAIIGRRLDGVITSWNSGARRLYGYTDEEVVGGYGFDLVPPERLNEMLTVLEKLRRRESIETHETIHLDKNGRRIDVA
ncbi:MAG TPA: PAS domain S-box protein, partial [Rubrobacter sp.]|nr:PAS domain S-box protein [Rubrobacter sp.]